MPGPEIILGAKLLVPTLVVSLPATENGQLGLEGVSSNFTKHRRAQVYML